jgi:hypothetical protein
MRLLILVTLFLTIFIVTGCQEETPETVETSPQPAQEALGESKETPNVDQEPIATEQQQQEEQKPPMPPIFEDFQGTPQLSLFPRAGDYRPEDESDRLPYWNTFIEHLVKVTGVIEEQTTGNREWAFRSINTIDSVGFFSPLSVVPQTEYHVSFKLTSELAEGASAGIGILEFNEFLWVPAQYTEELFNQHYRGVHDGKRLSGETKGEQAFTFTTGPDTRMIHLVLFREGTHDRNNVIFDDIGIEEVKE